MMDLFPIDLVVAWCDGADPVFAAKKAETMVQFGIPPNDEGAADVRHVAHDELRYLLRAAAVYLPWIRQIHLLVADFQTLPAWLVADAPRLNVVRHSAFIPSEALPTFNGCVIEYYLHRVPGLAERFLYANDDMMVLRPLRPDYFFDCRDGDPFVRLTSSVKFLSPQNQWGQSIQRADRLVAERFGVTGEFAKGYGMLPHHGIDAYRRSTLAAFAETFAEPIRRASRAPFRNGEEFSRKAFDSYALALGQAHFRRSQRRFCDRLSRTFLRPLLGDWCSTVCWLTGRDMRAELARAGRPGLICFNDNAATTPEEYAQLAAFLDELYPVPSAFEKKGA